MTNDWLTGIYLTTDEVLKYPDYVERLRDEIGLNYSGSLLYGPAIGRGARPQSIQGTHADRSRTGQARHSAFRRSARRSEGIPAAQALCGPGVAAQGDDEAFRRAVGQLKEAGLNVWTYGGAWTIRRLMFCPSRQDVQDWIEAVCVHWVTQYDLDALDITHFAIRWAVFP